MARTDYVPYVPWPKHGCTLAEALERTADRDAWSKWQRLKAAPANFGPNPKFVAGDSMEVVRDYHDLVRRHKKELAAADAQLRTSFRAHLTAGTLIAFGRPGSVAAERQVIPSDIWPALTNVDLDSSYAGDGRRDGVAYHAVQVFPALLAPSRQEVVAKLSGMTLSEAFRTYVLGDPQVKALAKLAIAAAPEYRRTYDEGRCHPHGMEQWPMRTGSPIAGMDLFDDPEWAELLSLPQPPVVVRACKALKERFDALFGSLRSGELIARGVSASDGKEAPIIRSVWSHDDFFFDARKGDMWQRMPRSDNKWGVEPRWHGVMLEQSSEFHVKPIAHDRLTPTTITQHLAPSQVTTTPAQGGERLRPKADEIAALLREIGLEDDPRGRSPGEIACEIAQKLKSPPKTARQLEAVRKRIGRHYKRLGLASDHPVGPGH